MTQKDKELLLKDLCARIPYGVKGIIKGGDVVTTPLKWYAEQALELSIGYMVVKNGWRPYLFPLSSLTEEQRNDISKLLIETQNEFSPYGKLNMKGCDNLFVCTVKQANVFINYCLTYHLDINGLIEKGLAIDATGLNIY
jgi:hypothetical protein